MTWAVFKIFLSAGVITFTSWLANAHPRLAGFIIALPLASMLALAFNFSHFQNETQSTAFAKSILVGVPLSLLFFVPFLFASRLGWDFWGLYVSGIVLLGFGFAIHSLLLS